MIWWNVLGLSSQVTSIWLGSQGASLVFGWGHRGWGMVGVGVWLREKNVRDFGRAQEFSLRAH